MERLFSYGFLALPTVFITLALLGALLAAVTAGAVRRAGIGLALAASMLLFAAATPALSSWLLSEAEAGAPPPADFAGAQAIVVLGGDVQIGNGGDIPDALGPWSMERVVFAADAYHRLHLPVAVSGGPVARQHETAAALMKAALERQFGVPVTWAENQSLTTWENAVDSARVLQPAGITRVVLVSQAWQMPRAIWAFKQAGLSAIPWPAPRTVVDIRDINDFLPDAGALHDSFFALHELIGALYYRLRY